MKLGVLMLLVLAAGSITAHFLLQDNGYVLINFRGYAIEMSVPILLLLLLVGYFLIRLLVRVWRAPRDLGEAAARARARRAGKRVDQGLAALAAGKLSRGERLLTKAAGNSPAPALNYLAAARVAQMQGDRERRDTWLQLASEQGDGAAEAVLLTQAELQLSGGERELAQQSLEQLLTARPQHPEALRLLAGLRRETGDWEGLAKMLPELRRLKSLGSEQLDEWQVDTWHALLAQGGLQAPDIEAHWQALPRRLRKRPDAIADRIRALLRCGASSGVDADIRRALKSGWDPELISLYAGMDTIDTAKQLAYLESWLSQRPEDPDLLLAAGQVCLRRKLWGKARSYLESSLGIRPDPATYQALGQLMLQLGENEAATDAFRKGLTLGYGGAPDVPQLAADPLPEDTPDNA